MRIRLQFGMKSVAAMVFLVAAALAFARYCPTQRTTKAAWIVDNRGSIQYVERPQYGSLWEELWRLAIDDRPVDFISISDQGIDDDTLKEIADAFPEATVLCAGSWPLH